MGISEMQMPAPNPSNPRNTSISGIPGTRPPKPPLTRTIQPPRIIMFFLLRRVTIAVTNRVPKMTVPCDRQYSQLIAM